MPRGRDHSITIPDSLWRDILELNRADPGVCPNPSDFILAATRRELTVFRAGSTMSRPRRKDVWPS
jgi:hypothetical protein